MARILKGLFVPASVSRALALLLALLLVPLAIVIVVVGERAANELRRHAIDEATALSALVASRVDDQLQSADALLRTLALNVAARPGSSADYDRLLRGVATDLPLLIRGISLFDTTGQLVGTSLDRTPPVNKLNVGDRQYFVLALRRKGLVVDKPIMSRATQVWSLPLAHRVVRDGKVVGVVAATPRLNEIGKSLMSNALPIDAVVTVLDTSGVVVARSRDPDHWVGRNIRDSVGVRPIMQHPESGVAYARSVDGAMRYGSWVRASRAPWIIYVGITGASNERAFRRERRAVFAVAVVLFLLAAYSGQRLVRRISQSLQRLAADADQLGSGNLGVRASVSGVQEIDRVALSFNAMAEALERQTALLRESNDRLATLVAASPMAIITLDHTGRVTSWNPAAERILGWKASAMIGKPLPEGLAHRTVDAATRVIDVQRADGTTVALAVAVAPLGGAEGTSAGAIIVAEDVTAQQRAEADLRHAQRIDAVGRLAGGVAHDFNNLLAIMTGAIALLKGHWPPNAIGRDDLDVLDDAAHQGVALTRQLLSFTRQGTRTPEVFDARQVIRDTERMLRRLVPANTLLDVELGDAALPVLMDSGQLEQVLVNLTLNARDALPDGGRIAVTANRVTESDGTHWANLCVADDGHGMDAETITKIFDPFFTTKPAGRGTGLGLSMVQDIIVGAGGRVDVTSAPGAGATICCRLPLARPDQVAASRPAVAVATPRGKEGANRTILVVDDEPALRRTLRRLLERHGYRVLDAADGTWALAELAEHPEIELVISDLMMPQMDGLTMVEHMRARGDQRPLILQTGFLDPRFDLRVQAVSRLTLLAKPVTWEALSGHLRTLLGPANPGQPSAGAEEAEGAS